MNTLELASKLELAILGHAISEEEIRKKLDKVKFYEELGIVFGGICVASGTIEIVLEHELKTKIVSVIGYPYGDENHYSKWKDIEQSIYAAHIDYVPNFTNVLKNDISTFMELNYIAEITSNYNREFRLIVEAGMLPQNKIEKLISLAEDLNADVIKTSTGTYKNDPSPTERIRRVRYTKLKVKVSGGIKDLKTAESCFEIGADIIGSSSALNIFEEFVEVNKIKL
jgi:deoxyribose-phosphate aldolase